MKKIKIVSSVFLLVLLGLILAACGSNAANGSSYSVLKVGATPSSTSHYSYFVALANSIKEGTNGKINVDVVETSASLDNIRLMSRGDIDFGLVTSYAQYDAYNGTGVFADAEPYEELRMFIPYSVAPVPIYVRADSGIETVYDLHGKKFNAGVSGSSTAEEVKLMLGTLGVEPDYVDASLDDAMEMIKNRQMVGFSISASTVNSPDASVLSLSTLIDMRVLGFSNEDAEKIEKNNPNLLRFEIPANVYDNQLKPLVVFGHTSAVGVSTTLPEEVVYEMFKATVENKAMQEEAFPSAKNHDYLDFIIETSPIPIHPGVIRYLEEQGIEVPEKLK